MADISPTISDDDRLFLTRLAKDIRARPDAFREAGQWLDKHYSKDRCWEREQTAAATGKNRPRDRRNVDRMIARFGLAVRDMDGEQLEPTAVTQVWSARRLLVLWLLTDPDADRFPSKLTEFQDWRWDGGDEPYPRRMALRGVHNWGEWMRLGRLASAAVSPVDVAPSGSIVPANENELHIASVPHMPPRAKIAYDLYEKAKEVLNKQSATDDEVYDAISAINEKEKERTGKANPMELPGRAVWKRYVRLARKALGQQKNSPRANRASTARSITSEFLRKPIKAGGNADEKADG